MTTSGRTLRSQRTMSRTTYSSLTLARSPSGYLRHVTDARPIRRPASSSSSARAAPTCSRGIMGAPSGARARVLFDEVKPALVVLDLGLPDANGIDLLKELRARADTPVIALTARAEDAERVAGLDAGMDDYLTKPFNPRELVSRVKAILRRKIGRASCRERV